ncbi:thiopurine S-methyltransferase [Pseudomonas folii]|uniref:Thiopurine S-methyltransferase n=1 Tax=Pseudomonas folii TaxID=2762593 RepID=A0ABR7B4Y9_9PSED|nr:thiopurine S-methyltransferase [Pseudomonas folii]MBC3952224.1 thiopurine S-methyltransferase [Pseudomonas folii]
MQAEFWHERWAANQIGFHQRQVNPLLQRFWPELAVGQGARVLVPLCGKSLDLVWLAGQGNRVLGVELSEKAVQDFFSEQRLEPVISQNGAFKVYGCEGIELWCGDFFALRAEDVAECTALYDRAALIALPPVMREEYVAHLSSALPAQCQGLLITLDYDQAKIDGPPFSVPDEEVQRLLAEDWELDILQTSDVLKGSVKFEQRGVERLEERVYRMVRR